jgi:D-alanine-D-alanine ligase
MKVLVLLGDNSPEREVSIRSGKAVAEALRKAGHHVTEYDPAEGYNKLAEFKDKVDCVFPILHGVGGEDGKIQRALESYGFKYLGSPSAVAQLCFNKVAFKQELEKLNILTPKWKAVTKDSLDQSLSLSPYVLKPIEGGSTIDAFIIRDPKTQTYPTEIFDRYKEMLYEELVEGAEITIPVLDKTALSVIEIIPPEGKEFDYENKYNGATQELCPPANVPEEKQVEARKLTEKIHAAVGARHLSRTDIIIDKTGQLYVLELNTMPGLTAQSLFPKSAKQGGLSMEQLVQKFLDMVMVE